MGMEALRLVWTFRTPMIVPAHPVHSDALLAWATVQRAIAMMAENPFDEQENLPLESAGEVWKASQLVFTPLGEMSLMPFMRKFGLADFAAASGVKYVANKKNTFVEATGRFKSFDLRLPTQMMAQAVAWCVGDRGQIEDLLRDVVSIGPQKKIGMGEVKSLTVEPCPADEAENWRIRVLPQGAGLELPQVKYVPAVACCRAPYWDRTKQREAMIPLVTAE